MFTEKIMWNDNSILYYNWDSLFSYWWKYYNSYSWFLYVTAIICKHVCCLILFYIFVVTLSLFFLFCWCDIFIVLGCSMDQLSVISFDHLFSSDFLHGALFYLQLSTFFCLHGLWGLLSALDVLPMRPLVRRCEINCLCVSPRRQSSPATRETGLR